MEPTAVGEVRKAEVEADGEPPKRRKRRSGWDTPLAAPAAPLATVAAVNPLLVSLIN
jgi:hypothetical protein